jgi:hypothetical protein
VHGVNGDVSEVLGLACVRFDTPRELCTTTSITEYRGFFSHNEVLLVRDEKGGSLRPCNNLTLMYDANCDSAGECHFTCRPATAGTYKASFAELRDMKRAALFRTSTGYIELQHWAYALLCNNGYKWKLCFLLVRRVPSR